MPRFAANLSMLYNEHEFLDRFAPAAQDGFQAVEYLFPYAFNAHDLKQRLSDNGLQQVLFNAPPGDWDAGERGLACLPGRENEFQTGFLKALTYADVLNNLVRLRLVVQEEARNVTGVDGFNQHITARFFGFSGGPRDVLNVGFF